MSAIPMPKALPFVGHMHIFATDNMIERFDELALRAPGGIYALHTPYGRLIVAYGADIVKELLDETRFAKVVIGPLENVREFAGDGLFTARAHQPNWAKAYRILTPAFTAPPGRAGSTTTTASFDLRTLPGYPHQELYFRLRSP